MKRLIILVFTIALCISASWAQADSMAQKWERANGAYHTNEYANAAVLYEDILSTGQHSAKLYFNLANAYFKQNQLGRAILNYNRALLLDPADEDISYNLQLANARTIDKIEPVPQFFLKSWFLGLGDICSSDAWAVIALVLFAVALAGVIAWLVISDLRYRKLGFYTALVSVVFVVMSLVYSQIGYARRFQNKDAIVMNSAAPVKSSPSPGSTDIFVIHEGTKVEVLGELDSWSEIKLEDGNKGWIATSAITPIW